MRKIQVIGCFLFCFSSANAFAGISLSQAIVHFEAGAKRSEDIEVFNQGTDTLYVRVIPSIIENPGTSEESRQPYHDPKSAGLLVTPQRLVIPPGVRKRLRFVRLDDFQTAKQDKVFRVLVKPEVGEVSSAQTAVKIIVAYEVLVLSQPQNPAINLNHQFVDGYLRVENSGNTNVLLQKGHQCPPDQSIDDAQNSCVELSGKRLYAGNQWQIELPFKTPVTYQYSVGLENSLIVFEPSDTQSR